MAHDAGQQLIALIPDIKADLPYSPALLGKLFKQTAGDSLASLADVSATIAADQGLTARILKLANSAFYGLQAEVSSVDRAVAMLGLKEVRTLVLSVGVSTLAQSMKSTGLLDIAAYWRHQLYTACCARDLAGGLSLPAEDMFTVGLLHDLGYLITAVYLPDEFHAALALRESEELVMADAEMRHFGLDHGVVGAMVLASWDLPREITEPVNWHHAPDKAPDMARQAALLCVADALARTLEDQNHRVRDHWTTFAADLGVDVDAAQKQLAERAEDEALKQLLATLAA